jgi:hypothetical protein
MEGEISTFIFRFFFKRLWAYLLEKLLFRLRYFVGFVLFAFVLWLLLKVMLPRLIDTEYWDGIQSDQFINLERRNQNESIGNKRAVR